MLLLFLTSVLLPLPLPLPRSAECTHRQATPCFTTGPLQRPTHALISRRHRQHRRTSPLQVQRHQQQQQDHQQQQGGVQAPVRVGIVGGGLSGACCAWLLSICNTTERPYEVTVIEKRPHPGGAIYYPQVPEGRITSESHLPSSASSHVLPINAGSPVHVGNFLNLNMLLRHFNVTEWLVGIGPNRHLASPSEPQLFRLVHILNPSGQQFVPPASLLRKPLLWLDVARFFLLVNRERDMTYEEFFAKHPFSRRLRNLLDWAIRTYEFDHAPAMLRRLSIKAALAYLYQSMFLSLIFRDAFQFEYPSWFLEQGWFASIRKESLAKLGERKRGHPHADETVARASSDPMWTADRPLSWLQYHCIDRRKLLAKLLEPVHAIRCHTQIVRAQLTADDTVQLTDQRGDTHVFDKVIFSAPPTEIAMMLRHTHTHTHSQQQQPAEQKELSRVSEWLESLTSETVRVQIIPRSQMSFDKGGGFPPESRQFPRESESADDWHFYSIYDITEVSPERLPASLLSVAVPVSSDGSGAVILDPSYNHTGKLHPLNSQDYPWLLADCAYTKHRQDMLRHMQGMADGRLFFTGHIVNGVFKNIESSVRAACELCEEHFSALPPWRFVLPPESGLDLDWWMEDLTHDTAKALQRTAKQLFQLSFTALIAMAVRAMRRGAEGGQPSDEGDKGNRASVKMSAGVQSDRPAVAVASD
ncbi:unnamed protein product [Vitrella brassicaformis CCMP3155]|uniref:Amine oxidase domain-containing protein n=2 Tax=Vitrella brassicaformis TaxID=1169539 RepID=A0A0G4H4P8_VITBC|nr:unnamed protein product [Vitrella brassicaformis CCMP3155]|eukprot:CEM38769.1 unnamed protein product [Vitrella brassicaformis CCMP3155]